MPFWRLQQLCSEDATQSHTEDFPPKAQVSPAEQCLRGREEPLVLLTRVASIGRPLLDHKYQETKLLLGVGKIASTLLTSKNTLFFFYTYIFCMFFYLF